jgi:hypothetical protein
LNWANELFLKNSINKEGNSSKKWQTQFDTEATKIIEDKVTENYKASEVACQSLLQQLYRDSSIQCSVEDKYSHLDGLLVLTDDICKLKSEYNSNQQQEWGPAKEPVYKAFYEEEVMFFYCYKDLITEIYYVCLVKFEFKKNILVKGDFL